MCFTFTEACVGLCLTCKKNPKKLKTQPRNHGVTNNCHRRKCFKTHNDFFRVQNCSLLSRTRNGHTCSIVQNNGPSLVQTRRPSPTSHRLPPGTRKVPEAVPGREGTSWRGESGVVPRTLHPVCAVVVNRGDAAAGGGVTVGHEGAVTNA